MNVSILQHSCMATTLENITDHSNNTEWSPESSQFILHTNSQVSNTLLLRATAGTAIARLSHRNSVRPSVLSVCHTGGSGKNGAS